MKPVYNGHETIDLKDNHVEKLLNDMVKVHTGEDEITKFLLDHQGQEILLDYTGRYQLVKIIDVDPFTKEFQHKMPGIPTSWMKISLLTRVQEKQG